MASVTVTPSVSRHPEVTCVSATRPSEQGSAAPAMLDRSALKELSLPSRSNAETATNCGAQASSDVSVDCDCDDSVLMGDVPCSAPVPR